VGVVRWVLTAAWWLVLVAAGSLVVVLVYGLVQPARMRVSMPVLLAMASVTGHGGGGSARVTVVGGSLRVGGSRALIYDLRAEAGLSQRELAERMGTTPTVISRVEEGAGANNRLQHPGQSGGCLGAAPNRLVSTHCAPRSQGRRPGRLSLRLMHLPVANKYPHLLGVPFMGEQYPRALVQLAADCCSWLRLMAPAGGEGTLAVPYCENVTVPGSVPPPRTAIM
jgi:Helix-turn-helix